MSRVGLSLAISHYDHVADLVAGRVVAEGIDLTCLDLTVEEIFFRFTAYREWDISEMSLGKYVSLLSRGDRSMTAIPVFPSRIFRHSAIYVRNGGRVRQPADLAGCKVGVAEWAQTAAVYVRGLLQHEYGVDLKSIDWVQAGVNQAGRPEQVELSLPQGLRLSVNDSRTLSEMLASGEIDAAISAHPPEAFEKGDAGIVRLFADFMAAEREYYDRTRIFPIMHVVAIRQDAVDRHPWIAGNLLRAFEEARDRSVARAFDVVAPRFPIPWCYEHARTAKESFGSDYWPYGIQSNRTTLDAFLQYAQEQGVAHRRLHPEDLFPPQVGRRFRI